MRLAKQDREAPETEAVDCRSRNAYEPPNVFHVKRRHAQTTGASAEVLPRTLCQNGRKVAVSIFHERDTFTKGTC